MELKKRIKQTLNEALGVPNELEMVTKIYTDLIMEELEFVIDSMQPEEFETKNDKIGEYTALKYQFVIGSSESWQYMESSPYFNLEEWRKFPTYRNKIEVNVGVYPNKLFKSQNTTSPQIEATHAFQPKKFKIKTLKSRGEVYDISKYEFTIHMSYEHLKNLELIRPRLSATISHELFHSYQLYKRYKSVNKVGYGKETAFNFLQQNLRSQWNPVWNDFMLRIYYSLRFEQQARAPQAYYELKSHDIKNYDDFIKALKTTDIWREIQFLKDFSPEKMIDSFKKIDSFEDLLLQGPKSMEFMQNLSNWNEFLNIIRTKLNETGLSVDPFRDMSGRYIEDPMLFLNYWKKIFDRRADELFKKITRLYDKVKTDDNN